jgi:hypothetical protein
VLAAGNLSGHYQSCPGAVRVLPKQGAPFVTKIRDFYDWRADFQRVHE